MVIFNSIFSDSWTGLRLLKPRINSILISGRDLWVLSSMSVSVVTSGTIWIRWNDNIRQQNFQLMWPVSAVHVMCLFVHIPDSIWLNCWMPTFNFILFYFVNLYSTGLRSRSSHSSIHHLLSIPQWGYTLGKDKDTSVYLNESLIIWCKSRCYF